MGVNDSCSRHQPRRQLYAASRDAMLCTFCVKRLRSMVALLLMDEGVTNRPDCRCGMSVQINPIQLYDVANEDAGSP